MDGCHPLLCFPRRALRATNEMMGARYCERPTPRNRLLSSKSRRANYCCTSNSLDESVYVCCHHEHVRTTKRCVIAFGHCFSIASRHNIDVGVVSPDRPAAVSGGTYVHGIIGAPLRRKRSVLCAVVGGPPNREQKKLVRQARETFIHFYVAVDDALSYVTPGYTTSTVVRARGGHCTKYIYNIGSLTHVLYSSIAFPADDIFTYVLYTSYIFTRQSGRANTKKQHY